MKTQVWVYIVVVVLSVGAGVAIAGVPSSVAVDPTIQPPATNEAPAPSEPAATEPATTEPADTEPADTEPSDTEPTDTEPSDTEPSDTEPSDTDPSDTDPSDTDPSETDPSDTEPSDTEVTTVLILEREDVAVSVANGANVAGVATLTLNFLEGLGYVDVDTFDGDEVVGGTVIFAAEGFQEEADRLAADLGLATGLVFPLDSASLVDGPGEDDVVVYLGEDVVNLPYFA